jgi:membrane protein required for colicin V production
MPSYLDLALLGIVVISALLSMVRGFAREVLAIASWGAAAVAAYLFYPRLMPYLEHYIAKDTIRMIAAIAIVFFVTLILVSIITVKLSDAILDSRIGALDRTLGFAFGAARGFLLGVVAFLFFNWLVPVKSQPDWVLNAKAKPLLQASGNEIVSLLPDDTDNILKRFKRDKSASGEDAPADADAPAGNTDTAPAPVPPRRADPAPPAPAPKTTAATAPTATDKQSLDSLINGPAQASAPSKAAKKKQ